MLSLSCIYHLHLEAISSAAVFRLRPSWQQAAWQVKIQCTPDDCGNYNRIAPKFFHIKAQMQQGTPLKRVQLLPPDKLCPAPAIRGILCLYTETCFHSLSWVLNDCRKLMRCLPGKARKKSRRWSRSRTHCLGHSLVYGGYFQQRIRSIAYPMGAGCQGCGNIVVNWLRKNLALIPWSTLQQFQCHKNAGEQVLRCTYVLQSPGFLPVSLFEQSGVKGQRNEMILWTGWKQCPTPTPTSVICRLVGIFPKKNASDATSAQATEIGKKAAQGTVWCKL